MYENDLALFHIKPAIAYLYANVNNVFCLGRKIFYKGFCVCGGGCALFILACF